MIPCVSRLDPCSLQSTYLILNKPTYLLENIKRAMLIIVFLLLTACLTFIPIPSAVRLLGMPLMAVYPAKNGGRHLRGRRRLLVGADHVTQLCGRHSIIPLDGGIKIPSPV